MSRLPRLSIVTPCYNSQTTLRETIESVHSQGYPDLEHLVIDGGSTDGTLEILRASPQLTWISEKDEGQYHAMNKGIARATGEVVAILNADDRYRPGALRAVGEAFARHPEWDALFGDIIYVGDGDREIFRREEALYDYRALLWGAVCYVVHPTLFIRRAVYERLGAYRHREYISSADYELALRLGRAGCRVGHVPHFLVTYRYHQQGQSSDLRITRNMARENERIRTEYGCPSDSLDRVRQFIGRSLRQLEKLLVRGRCDLHPASWTLRKYMHQTNRFDSNIDLERLEKGP